MVILILLVITLWIIFRFHRRKRAATVNKSRCPKPRTRQESSRKQEQTRQQILKAKAAAEKKRQQKEEASSDLNYYISRMDDLHEMIWVIDSQLEIARKNIETDRSMNEYGAIITDKTIKAHSEEYTKLQKQALTIENQIHALEKKIARAKYILAS